MKPAHDIYNRLIWDTGLCPAFTVGYEDRFLGVLEVSRDEFEEAEIPFHRVRYYRNSVTNEIIWDRTTRVDLITSYLEEQSSNPSQESLPNDPVSSDEAVSHKQPHKSKKTILKEKRQIALTKQKLDARQQKDDEESIEKAHNDELEARLREVNERIKKFDSDLKKSDAEIKITSV